MGPVEPSLSFSRWIVPRLPAAQVPEVLAWPCSLLVFPVIPLPARTPPAQIHARIQLLLHVHTHQQPPGFHFSDLREAKGTVHSESPVLVPLQEEPTRVLMGKSFLPEDGDTPPQEPCRCSAIPATGPPRTLALDIPPVTPAPGIPPTTLSPTCRTATPPPESGHKSASSVKTCLTSPFAPTLCL